MNLADFPVMQLLAEEHERTHPGHHVMQFITMRGRLTEAPCDRCGFVLLPEPARKKGRKRG